MGGFKNFAPFHLKRLVPLFVLLHCFFDFQNSSDVCSKTYKYKPETKPFIFWPIVIPRGRLVGKYFDFFTF